MDFSNTTRMVRAYEDFNKVSRVKLRSAEEFQNLISVSPQLRAWYADWTFRNSAYSTMPESFRRSGITPEKWQDIQKLLPKINDISKQSSINIEKAAAEFDRKREVYEDERNKQLANLETPEIKILKVNITNLPFETQVEIFTKPAEERQDFENMKIEELREKLLNDLKSGNFKDPFQFQDFKSLLVTK